MTTGLRSASVPVVTFLDTAEHELELALELAAIMRTAQRTIMHSSAAEEALESAAVRQDGIAETWRLMVRTYSEHGAAGARAAAASLIVQPSTASPAFLEGARHAAGKVLHALQVSE